MQTILLAVVIGAIVACLCVIAWARHNQRRNIRKSDLPLWFWRRILGGK